MLKIRTALNYLPVILGALYLIADANEMDYDYAWDHSIYPPFTGKQTITISECLSSHLLRHGRKYARMGL